MSDSVMMADEQIIFPYTLETLLAASVLLSWYSYLFFLIPTYIVTCDTVVDTQIA